MQTHLGTLLVNLHRTRVVGSKCLTKSSSNSLAEGAAIAQWIRLLLPSCCPRFESQACHLCFFHL